MIFPEGTRFRGKELGRFRDGAFLLARKKKKAVLPIAISYSHDSVSDEDLARTPSCRTFLHKESNEPETKSFHVSFTTSYTL